MNVLFFFLIMLKFVLSNNINNIKLTNNNFVSLRESVTDKSIGKVISDLSAITTDNNNQIYLFLDTPGGSVVAGNNLIDHLNYLNSTGVKINCIAKTAISMGFVILQQCPGDRLALPSAVLMQHQMSTTLSGNILNIEKDFIYSKKLYERLIYKQSKRIGMSPDEFKEKTRDDWWLDGETALENNIVDRLVNLGCSKKVVNQKVTINKYSSQCPLINF